MKQWEYKTVIGYAIASYELDKLGEEGWELVSFKHGNWISGDEAILKRPKKETYSSLF